MLSRLSERPRADSTPVAREAATNTGSQHFWSAFAATQAAGEVRPKWKPGQPLRMAPKLGVLNFESSGNLVVATGRDNKADPALSNWLERHCAKALELPEGEARVKYLQEAVRQTFKMGFQPILHPIRARKFRELMHQEREEAILLGDLIENRTGVCRHGTLLFQLAAQQVGIVSVMCQGTKTNLDLDSGKPDSPAYGHAWNLVTTTDGSCPPHKVMVLDFMEGSCVIERFATALTHDALGSIFGRELRKTRVAFDKYSEAIFEVGSSARNFERDLNDEYTRKVIEYAFSHSSQRTKG